MKKELLITRNPQGIAHKDVLRVLPMEAARQ